MGEGDWAPGKNKKDKKMTYFDEVVAKNNIQGDDEGKLRDMIMDFDDRFEVDHAVSSLFCFMMSGGSESDS